LKNALVESSSMLAVSPETVLRNTRGVMGAPF
jgi:hypothetical protein